MDAAEMAPGTIREVFYAKFTGALSGRDFGSSDAVDSEHFAALQVAFAYHGPFGDEVNAEIDQRLQALAFTAACQSCPDRSSAVSSWLLSRIDEPPPRAFA